ncbi:MAG: oligosaccharide flippase family protein [Ignavibacteria bacterium]|nr:oligosaccharide flippase family protein [Ignavibacteria bacterium]
MKLVINFISKLGVDSVSKLIGFITLPLITRALGPDGYGKFTYLFVILSYFGFFIDFGYLSYGTNKLCEKTDSRVVIGKIISLQLLTAIFSYIILIIVAYFFLETGKYILLLFFSSIFISQIFSIRYYYLAGNKLYYNSISELAGQLIYAALIFTVFINHQSVFTLIIVSLVQAYVTAIFLFLPYIRKNKIKLNLSPVKI